MRVAALILGILGGLFGLGISFYGQLALSMFSEGAQKAFGILIVYAIPIASLVGGGMAISNAQAAAILMLASTAGWFALGAFFGYGFNFITMSPMILSGIGGMLALAAVNANGVQKPVDQAEHRMGPPIKHDPGATSTQQYEKPPLDYYSIISPAIGNLDPNTEATRKSLYDRARQAVTKQLRFQNPEMSEPKIRAELASLEAAIRRMENELTKPTTNGPQVHGQQANITTPSAIKLDTPGGALDKPQQPAIQPIAVAALVLIGLGGIAAVAIWGQSQPNGFSQGYEVRGFKLRMDADNLPTGFEGSSAVVQLPMALQSKRCDPDRSCTHLQFENGKSPKRIYAIVGKDIFLGNFQYVQTAENLFIEKYGAPASKAGTLTLFNISSMLAWGTPSNFAGLGGLQTIGRLLENNSNFPLTREDRALGDFLYVTIFGASGGFAASITLVDARTAVGVRDRSNQFFADQQRQSQQRDFQSAPKPKF